LKEPIGNEIRPTSGFVKESVFNIVQFDIEGRSILDLFAGTGQIGIEALSRGARSAAFVDSSPRSIKLIKENLELCKVTEFASVYSADVLRFLERDEKFDFIYVDPPYDSMLAETTLLKIAQLDKININGIMLTESRYDTVLPVLVPPYEIVKEYKYGNVKLTKHTRKP